MFKAFLIISISMMALFIWLKPDSAVAIIIGGGVAMLFCAPFMHSEQKDPEEEK